MQHELPSPRHRRVSIQDPEASPATPSWPLSSSFYAEIDPLTPARHSSLHLYPQHIFPSKLNRLDTDLDVPYAFSHQNAAFYWTREDALTNRKLNIWQKPPCQNCVLAGDDHAQSCDRYQRQEDSLGQIFTCTRCKVAGNSEACVEQVEIRADDTYGHVDESRKRQLSQWCSEEQELRSAGIVRWFPINLDVGDVERKRLTVEESKRKSLPGQDTKYGGAYWIEALVALPHIREKMRIGQEMNHHLVADWDEEDLYLEPQLLVLRAEAHAISASGVTADAKSASNAVKESQLGKSQDYW